MKGNTLKKMDTGVEILCEEKIFKFRVEIQNLHASYSFQRFVTDELIWFYRVHTKEKEGSVVFYLKRYLSSEHFKYKITVKDSNDNVIQPGDWQNSYCYQKGLLHTGIRGVCTVPRNKIIEATSSSKFVVRFICEVKLTDKKYFSSDMIEDQMSVPKEFKTRSCKEFFDVNLQMGDKVIPAHKLVLSAHSSVFYDQLMDLDEAANNMKIDDFSFETIQDVINFIYDNHEFKLTDLNVLEIFKASVKYRIRSLETRCKEFLIKNLDLKNVLDIQAFVFANGLYFDEAYDFAKKYIRLLMNSNDSWENYITTNPKAFRDLFEYIMFDSSSCIPSRVQNGLDEVFFASNEKTLSKLVLVDFEKLFTNMKHSDVVFEIEEKTLRAHKSILSCRSTVFEAMFDYETTEAKENCIKIVDCEYEIMKELLRFMYYGRVDNLKENAMKLFVVADKYDITTLKSLCQVSMSRNIQIENVIEMFELVLLYSLKDLKEKVIHFVLVNFREVSELDDWDDFAERNPKVIIEMLRKLLEYSAYSARCIMRQPKDLVVKKNNLIRIEWGQ